MSKYIKQDDVFELVRNGVLISNSNFESVCKHIGSLPTIDIVRCEDCRHSTYTVKNRVTHETFYACPYSCINHEGKFFCAYGERIEE